MKSTRGVLVALAVLVAALVASGCIVTSIHPFYADSQVFFDEGLVGVWDNGDNESWEFARDKEKNNYIVTIAAKKVVGVMEGRLFRVGGQTFMDLYPWSFDYTVDSGSVPNVADEGLYWNNMHLQPVHSVMKITRSGADSLSLAILDKDWLFNQMKTNPGIIKHEIPRHTTTTLQLGTGQEGTSSTTSPNTLTVPLWDPPTTPPNQPNLIKAETVGNPVTGVRLTFSEKETLNDDENILLSASTAELQAFLAKYGTNTEAFEPEGVRRMKTPKK